MVFMCCVPNCSSINKEHKMRSFPKDPTLFAKWIEVVNREDLLQKGIDKVRIAYRVCDAHFHDNDRFGDNKNRTNLKRTAVPSLYLDGPPLPSKTNRHSVQATSELAYINTSISLINEIPQLKLTNKGLTLRSKRDSIQANIKSAHIYSGTSSSNEDSTVDHEEVICTDPFIDRRCRVCLSENHSGIPLNHITNIDGDPKSLHEILSICVDVQISLDDSKPQTICVDCVEMAKTAFEFRMCCKRSNIKLQNEVRRSELNNEAAQNFVKKHGSPSKVILSETGENSYLHKIIKEDLKTYSHINLPTGKIIAKADKLKRTNQPTMYSEQRTPIEIGSEKIAHIEERDSLRRRHHYCKYSVCVQCSKYFYKYAKFKLAMHVFIGLKRYKCKKCGARFALIRNFNLHKKSHNTRYNVL